MIEWLLTAIEPTAVMFGLTPENTIYLFSLVISISVGLSVGIKFQNPMAGVVGVMGCIIALSMLGLFPLWIVAIPVLLLIYVAYHGGRNE